MSACSTQKSLDVATQRVRLRFEVEDTGIGMSAAEASTVFDSFSQVGRQCQPVTLVAPASGLRSTSRLVELMGGEIAVRSSDGDGSLFWFSAQFDQGIEGPAPTELPAELHEMPALVVNNSDAARLVFRSYIDDFGMNTTDVSSSSDALALVRANARTLSAFRLIVADRTMQDLGGVDLARAIWDDDTVRPKPEVILTSAFGRQGDDDELSAVGVRRVLLKPVTRQRLLNGVLYAFGYRDTTQPETAFISRRGRSGPERGSVLLVEDNVINQQVATELLRSAGYEVCVAANGKVALEMLDQYSVRAVLMDIQMPVMDGFAATRALRADPRFRDLPVLAMSANSSDEDVAEAGRAGMNGHIAKPVNVRELLAKLHDVIRESRPA